MALLLWVAAAAVAATAPSGCRPAADGRAPAAAECSPFDHSHSAWSELLQRHVRNGFVDYSGWRRAGERELDVYLAALESVCRDHYVGWSRPQKLAFWINAYNAYTVRLILDHYPLDSIRDIGLLPGAAFRKDFIQMQRLRGATIDLNEVEHTILRSELREPRIHFAITCASTSCPALRSEAYRATVLDRQLDDAARGFLRDPTKNRFDMAAEVLWLSPIFDWFDEDFVRAAGSLTAYVAPFAEEPTARAIAAGRVRVRFLRYDWSLNGR